MLSPDSGEGTQAAGSLDVADNTDHNHGRGLDDGDSLNDLLLVHLGTRSVQIAHDVGHAGLVAEHGSEVHGLLGVILGETEGSAKGNETQSPRCFPTRKFYSRLNLTAVPGGTLARQETGMTVSWVLVLAVRHC